jgi:hypothetical protein
MKITSSSESEHEQESVYSVAGEAARDPKRVSLKVDDDGLLDSSTKVLELEKAGDAGTPP